MKKLVVLTSENYGHVNGTGLGVPPLDVPPHVPMRGVNVMLGGWVEYNFMKFCYTFDYVCKKI